MSEVTARPTNPATVAAPRSSPEETGETRVRRKSDPSRGEEEEGGRGGAKKKADDGDAEGGRFTTIPSVSLQAWRDAAADDRRRAEMAREVRAVCHHVGFFVLVDHGVENAAIDSIFETCEKFFSLPREEKQKIDKRRSRHFRGWEDVGSERTNNRVDVREQVDLWTENEPRPRDVEPHYFRLLGPNQWPDEDDGALLLGFRLELNRWFERMSSLAGEIMEMLAVGLELPPDYFESRFGGRERMSLVKLISYPRTPPGQFGVNAHHDTGFLTILAAGRTPGLEVENADGTWVPVPVIPHSFVVNLGEMLQSMTGNYYVATPHRVRTREPRLSVGYFHGPALDASLGPIEELADAFADAVEASPRHRDAGFMARSAGEAGAGAGDMRSRHRPDVYGEQLWNYFSRSYPENVALHYPPRPDGK